MLGLLLVVAFPRSGTGWSFLSGTLAGLLGAVATGFIFSYARATTRPSGRVEAASGSSLLAAFLIAPLAVLFPSGQGSGSGWVWVLALGALVAFGRLHSDLLRSGSGRSGAIAAAKAVGMVLVVLGGAFLGQPLSFGQWLGAVLILGSSGLILPLFPDGSATSARR